MGGSTEEREIEHRGTRNGESSRKGSGMKHEVCTREICKGPGWETYLESWKSGDMDYDGDVAEEIGGCGSV